MIFQINMFQVRGIFFELSIMIQIVLSSCMLQKRVGVSIFNGKFEDSSFMRRMKVIISHESEDNTMYSYSVVDKSTWDCNLDLHYTGQFKYEMIYTVLEITFFSLLGSLGFHPPVC